MRLDFAALDETAIGCFYGGQGETLARMYADEHNRIMRGSLAPGFCHYCPMGHTHSLENTGKEDLLFFAVVTQS